MRKLLLVLVLAGCGGTGAPPADTGSAPPAALDGLLAGAWIVVSDAGVVPQNCGGARPMDPGPPQGGGCTWRDVWTFAAVGGWTRDVQGTGHFAGTWSSASDTLTISAPDSGMDGPYQFADCGRAARCLQFAPGWGTLILSR